MEGFNDTEAVVNEIEKAEQSDAASQDAAPDTKVSDILDIGGVEKFKFKDKEWTPQDLEKAILMQSDYTKKTQAIAQERKFYDNLAIDLNRVKADNSLAAQFKAVYPGKFHAYLDHVLRNQEEQKSEQKQNQAQEQYAKLDPKTEERLARFEQDLQERRIEAINSELDQKFEKLSKKYPFADEETAIARADAYLKSLAEGETITEEAWDQIFKSVHDRNQKRYDEFYSKRVQEQKSANARGRDVAPGGGTVGHAPKTPKTIREASAMALQELNAT